MVFEVVVLFLGLVMLIKGADILVNGSVLLGEKWGVSGLFLGLTVVAFGTSIPELFVGLFAAFSDKTDIPLGNIIGSNLINILLILGASAVIYGAKVKKEIAFKDIPFSLLAALILFIVGGSLVGRGIIGRIEGVIMLSFFSLYLYYMYLMAKYDMSHYKGKYSKERSYFYIVCIIVLSLIFLFLGAKLTVESVIKLARSIGISEYLISAVVVAAGTTLPELTTSLIAFKKKKADIGIGNLIGSNIFNILFILGLVSVINPVGIDSFVIFDMLFLIFISILLFSYLFVGKKYFFGTWKGILFLGLYILYFLLIVYRG